MRDPKPTFEHKTPLKKPARLREWYGITIGSRVLMIPMGFVSMHSSAPLSFQKQRHRHGNRLLWGLIAVLAAVVLYVCLTWLRTQETETAVMAAAQPLAGTGKVSPRSPALTRAESSTRKTLNATVSQASVHAEPGIAKLAESTDINPRALLEMTPITEPEQNVNTDATDQMRAGSLKQNRDIRVLLSQAGEALEHNNPAQAILLCDQLAQLDSAAAVICARLFDPAADFHEVGAERNLYPDKAFDYYRQAHLHGMSVQAPLRRLQAWLREQRLNPLLIQAITQLLQK